LISSRIGSASAGRRFRSRTNLSCQDRRALHILETVEAEAMPANVLRALLRGAIEKLLPERALAIARIEEQSAREYFERIASLKVRR
jgi:hypothetical protein